jgi:hypothetical protein
MGLRFCIFFLRPCSLFSLTALNIYRQLGQHTFNSRSLYSEKGYFFLENYFAKLRTLSWLADPFCLFFISMKYRSISIIFIINIINNQSLTLRNEPFIENTEMLWLLPFACFSNYAYLFCKSLTLKNYKLYIFSNW